MSTVVAATSVGEYIQGCTSTTQQGGSQEAPPPPTSEEHSLPIVFTPEEEAEFRTEVLHLSQFSVICRVIGAWPNRGELKDLIQGSLQDFSGRIKDVQFLGKGFYHVEVDTIDAVRNLLQHSPIDIRGARAFVMPWKQGFNPVEVLHKGERIFPITVVFPGLRKEYLPMISAIAARIGSVVKVQESMAATIAKSSGLPSARIVVGSLERLPTKILLPNGEGESIEQRVEFSALPGQCFYCRNMGHLAKDCPRKTNKREDQHQRCEFCKKEGHVAENCQAKVSSEGMKGQVGSELGKQQWIPVNAKRSFKSAHGIPQETYQSPNSFDTLDLVIDTQDGGDAFATELCQQKSVNTSQDNQGIMDQSKLKVSVEQNSGDNEGVAVAFGKSRMMKATKRTIRSRKSDNAIAIRTCVLENHDVGSGGFSMLDYAAPFGHDFTKHLGVENVHEPNPIRMHVLLRQREATSPIVGYSFPLCGYEKSVWAYADVMLAIRGQVLHFAKYVECSQLGEAILVGLEHASFSIVPTLDAMNRRHVIIDVISDTVLEFGYVYIHEDGVTESQAKARGHHHWRFIKEGCEILKGRPVDIAGNTSATCMEPSSKSRRMDALTDFRDS